MDTVFDERRYLIPFRAMLLPQIFTDVLVIGEGVAGLSAALASAEHGDVIVAAKGSLPDSNTYWAQGGIAAVLSPQDSLKAHVDDTIEAGAGLCDSDVVQQTVEAGPGRIQQLARWGMHFDPRDPRGGSGDVPWALGREGGHRVRRIVHSAGDATGKALSSTLERQVRGRDNIRIFEKCFVIDLVTTEGDPPRCIGAITHHTKYGLQMIFSPATILASGGVGQLYRESTNPAAATSDGLAMAYRAGAVLADLAFVQFHPTTLYVAGASRTLITEAVRGEGAVLCDRNGVRFMGDYHKMADLAPRDIVSRAILSHLVKVGHTHVYLDCRPIAAHFAQRFPGISKLLKDFGINPATDLIPIHPSAHYMIGGVQSDASGRTTLSGLYACGEVACTGLHGANRLASNSLLEGLVFGEIAGRSSREMVQSNGRAPAKLVSDIRPSDRCDLDVLDVWSSLRSVMWRHVGIERTGDHLADVEEMFTFWARYTLDKIFDDHMGWQLQNMLLAGALITRAALWRCESRGTHYRLDHREPDEKYHLHDLWKRGLNRPQTRPVNVPVGAAERDVPDARPLRAAT